MFKVTQIFLLVVILKLFTRTKVLHTCNAKYNMALKVHHDLLVVLFVVKGCIQHVTIET